MKTSLLILAVSAAFAQPALAATSVIAEAQAPGAIEKHIDEHIEKHLERHIIINGVDVLADAAGARASADAVRASAESWRAWADEFARDMESSFTYRFSDRVGRGRVVKGAPYSAQAAIETNRTLADGNVISKQSTSRVYRDGEGRTRQESLADGKVRSVYIHDPVAGESYTLLPEMKRATVLPKMSMPSLDAKTDEKGRKKIIVGGKEIVVDGNKPIIVTTHEGGEGDGTKREEIRVQVIGMGGHESKEVTITTPPLPPLPPLPPAPPLSRSGSMHLDGAIARGKVTTATLGEKDIEGVKAEGKSSTTVIAAGEIGNRNAIQVTSETWTSPELQVTLYSRSMDPRYGETLYKLTNIRRGEPSADFFKVPDDYRKSGRGAREGRG